MHTHTHIPRSVRKRVYVRRYIYIYIILCIICVYYIHRRKFFSTDIPVFGTPILDIYTLSYYVHDVIYIRPV